MDKTCGSKIPNGIVASSNHMLVEFITDGAHTASGFQAIFIAGKSDNKENGTENSSMSNQLHSLRKNIEELLSMRVITSFLAFDIRDQFYTGPIYSFMQMGPQ